MRAMLLVAFFFALGSVIFWAITAQTRRGGSDGIWSTDRTVNSFRQARDFVIERGQRFVRDARQGIKEVRNTDYRPIVRKVTKFVVGRVSHFVQDLGTALGNVRAVEGLFASGE